MYQSSYVVFKDLKGGQRGSKEPRHQWQGSSKVYEVISSLVSLIDTNTESSFLAIADRTLHSDKHKYMYLSILVSKYAIPDRKLVVPLMYSRY